MKYNVTIFKFSAIRGIMKEAEDAIEKHGEKEIPSIVDQALREVMSVCEDHWKER